VIQPIEVKAIRIWGERVIYALMIAGMTISMLMATAAIWEAYFNNPPLAVTSLDEPDLGVLCPGDTMNIHNKVEIRDNIIVHYFVSVMDKEGRVNIVGTQRAFTDFLHPNPTTFQHELPWTVPTLPPGDYLRVFAVRKVSGNEDTIFSMAHFKIGEACNE
jgi:hypothetical protein